MTSLYTPSSFTQFHFEVFPMKTLRFILTTVLLSLAVPVVMHAQGGCVDSPEAPTDVLMLVGSIGMMYGSSVAIKLLRKRREL
jgi:XrtJ-associated TM-motif-TM protein